MEIFDYAALFETCQHNTQAERFALNPVITKTSVIVNKPCSPYQNFTDESNSTIILYRLFIQIIQQQLSVRSLIFVKQSSLTWH